MTTIRLEQPTDHEAVFGVNSRAFDTDLEARLVDGLRVQARPYVALVAEADGQVVGHIAFTPVSVGERPATSRTLGLAPMAVLPEYQCRGIGSQLVRSGLDACRDVGAELVFVLGHPGYYPRFGFQPAAPHGLHYLDATHDPSFFVLELEPGALQLAAGLVSYHPLFSEEGA